MILFRCKINVGIVIMTIGYVIVLLCMGFFFGVMQLPQLCVV